MPDNTSTPPTQWQQLRVSAPSRQIDDLADFLTAAGALAITYVDRADDPILEPDPGTTPLWQQTSVVALFADTTELEPIVQAMHTRLGASLFCEREILVDQDWERACLRDFKPMRFGSNFWICPSWDVVKDPAAVVVTLDPGLAFGTGTHPTTALCLEWLATRPLVDKTVIDFGCGSGILAIAAARLGARHIYAIDHDPQALQATRDNAIKNGVSSRIGVAATVAPNSPPVELITANILLEPLIDLAETFYRNLHAQGRLVISGILQTQIDLIKQTYTPRFKIQSEQTMENWACVEFLRGD